MLANYKILTVTHKLTQLREIGDFVVKAEDGDELKSRLEEIRDQFQLDELLYLPTCNRVMYFFITSQSITPSFIARFFQHVNPGLPADTLRHPEGVVQCLEGEAALEHLLDVSASIDSLVIGERQILRQLRESFGQCWKWGLSGDFIRLAFQQAVVAAKAVYSNTRIGEKPVSVVSLAIQQLMKANLNRHARILLIGAGQTNQLVGKFLLKHAFSNVTVFNRTLGKAGQLAGMLKGKAQLLDSLPAYTEGFDCLIVCTGATNAVITPELYAALLQGDKSQKVVIDLAVPHNVSEAVVEDNDVNYIEVEGLRQLAKANLAFREQEIEEARNILKEYLKEFPALHKQRQIELAMRRVPTEIKAVKHKAINEVFRKEVEMLDGEARELMERMMAYMEKKCIGIPMKAAREAVLAGK
ncbi:MAG: glutamyl-tRNA reductase [Lewinellaceae bacterium]|nr:glutamyl-tRNA reductase [Lewinellaceae bacterium]